MSITLLIIAGCKDAEEGIVKEFDKEGIEISITITSASSVSDMKRKAWEYEEGIQGQALYSPNDNKCEIIIYKPQRVDDEATLTLGHELIHCLYGDYHD